MFWQRYGLIALAALPLLLYYGNGYRLGCNELGDYVFTAEAGQSSLGDGETTELKFLFYPVPDRRLTLHTSLHEQIDLRSSETVDDRPATLPRDKGPKESRTYGNSRPLTVSIPVVRTDQDDGTVLLGFGKYGSISAMRDATIKLYTSLYPTMTCAYDSREGVSSDHIMLHLK